MVYYERMEEVPPGRHMRKYLPLLLTLAIGAAVSVAVFFVFLVQENARLRADFDSMAADRAQAIRFTLSEDKVELGLIADNVSASTELSRGDLGAFVQEFGRLARRISTTEEDTQVIAFISSLRSPDRASFEALMRKSMDAGFEIREAAPGGALRPAGSRPQYFPIAVVEPEQYSSLLGLDIVTIPALRSAMEHAIASGKATASAAVDLPLSESGAAVVWNFRAIHRSARISDPTANRTGLLGICATAYRIDQLVELALKELVPPRHRPGDAGRKRSRGPASPVLSPLPRRGMCRPPS